ncbi:protein of unknown function (plasmid) [Cupriavidus neocaledonicus]|uniref:Uncharacterized protein n=1 Tax=Cupriavidus neocaledonicus TaxID=1040979 RepID=A0A375HQZ6_9BURK|nr:hypothetical protein CBM2605_B130410 [Cupriavidus neocaledonicus]SPD59217.1 protein of unknown function [Cupriavidus neocaledonicus]
MPPGFAFTPLMTCNLCDTTAAAQVRAGFDAGAFAAARPHCGRAAGQP